MKLTIVVELIHKRLNHVVLQMVDDAKVGNARQMIFWYQPNDRRCKSWEASHTHPLYAFVEMMIGRATNIVTIGEELETKSDRMASHREWLHKHITHIRFDVQAKYKEALAKQHFPQIVSTGF